eukprot:2320783-Prymnesium_polylepis.1
MFSVHRRVPPRAVYSRRVGQVEDRSASAACAQAVPLGDDAGDGLGLSEAGHARNAAQGAGCRRRLLRHRRIDLHHSAGSADRRCGLFHDCDNVNCGLRRHLA